MDRNGTGKTKSAYPSKNKKEPAKTTLANGEPMSGVAGATPRKIFALSKVMDRNGTRKKKYAYQPKKAKRPARRRVANGKLMSGGVAGAKVTGLILNTRTWLPERLMIAE